MICCGRLLPFVLSWDSVYESGGSFRSGNPRCMLHGIREKERKRRRFCVTVRCYLGPVRDKGAGFHQPGVHGSTLAKFGGVWRCGGAKSGVESRLTGSRSVLHVEVCCTWRAGELGELFQRKGEDTLSQQRCGAPARFGSVSSPSSGSGLPPFLVERPISSFLWRIHPLLLSPSPSLLSCEVMVTAATLVKTF